MPELSRTRQLPAVLPEIDSTSSRPSISSRISWVVRLGLAILVAFTWLCLRVRDHRIVKHRLATRPSARHSHYHGWGPFPRPNDPFHFLPCTNRTLLPPRLDDPHPLESWKLYYQSHPNQWLRGSLADKGALYLCVWLDVPLDYTNDSDPRIARLAVTQFQLDPVPSHRTLVVQPGGVGSGTQLVLSEGELISIQRSRGTFDILGWDPRGIPASQPSMSCFPADADRDRWKLLIKRSYREEEANPRRTMLVADAMNQAVFEACKARYGDVAGMLTTTFVARDLEKIRVAIAEDQLSGYFVGYGTEIGQIYANMFPESVGRLVLDGVISPRSDRRLASYFLEALDNVTDTFHHGFLGECVDAGPDRCALARPLSKGDPSPTKQDLIQAMQQLFNQLLHRRIPGYTSKSGPVIVTYSQLARLLAILMQDPLVWRELAAALFELLRGNATPISQLLDAWEYDPSREALPPSTPAHSHGHLEMFMLVVCSDQYDNPLPEGYDVETNGEQWYLDRWRQMTQQAQIAADRYFLLMLACRHWNSTFEPPKEVYHGDLNHTLANPLLLIGTTYDPATPLRHARLLQQEMGHNNARLIAHHGYGHLSDDKSTCPDNAVRSYLVNGTLPHQPETQCLADRKPYSLVSQPILR